MKPLLLTTTMIILTAPMVVFGQAATGDLTYKSMTVLPGNVNGLEGATLSTLFSSLYLLSIGLAALLAVFKIIIAGLKFMLTDAIPSRGDAKKDIEGALLGLILIISAVLILNVINPAIVGLDPAPKAAGT